MKKNIKNIWKKTKELPLWVKFGLSFSLLYLISLIYFYSKCGQLDSWCAFGWSLTSDILLITSFIFSCSIPLMQNWPDSVFFYVFLDLVVAFLLGALLGLVVQIIKNKIKKKNAR